MRYLLTLLFGLVLCTCVRAQVGVAMDAEYVDFCMVDSLPGGQLIRFQRLINVGTLERIDIDPMTGNAYAPQGFLFRCEDKDLSAPDPLQDFYKDCQCTYTSSQENHRVIEIRGGNDQDYTVEYQEVVRRKCSSESSPVVIFRDTLTRTDPFRTTNRIEYQIDFGVGDYVDDLSIRRYLSAASSSIFVIDLDPATVQSTYPGLTLDPADFSFDGTNLADIAAAYQSVLDHVFPTPINQVTVSFDDFLDAIIVSTQYMHEPIGTYVILPGADDLSFSVTGPASINGSGIVTYAHGLTTSTSDYPTACNETINTVESTFYFTFDPLEPRTIQPLVGVTPLVVTGLSNPNATCDAPAELCANLATTSISIDGCLSICDTVSVTVVETCNPAISPSHQSVANTTSTLTADTYFSVSLTVVTGPVTVTIDGQAVDYPAGYSARWAAPDKCSRLSQSFTVDASAGSVLIATLE